MSRSIWVIKIINIFTMIGPTCLRFRANSELIVAFRQTSCLDRKVNKYWEWCETKQVLFPGSILVCGDWWLVGPQHPLYSGDHEFCPVRSGTTYLQTDQLWLKYQSEKTFQFTMFICRIQILHLRCLDCLR